jgi:hypothetical protein
MARIYTSVDQLIGHTPLLELTRLEADLGLKARVLAKLEYLNPAGSVKDRVAKSMLDDAEAKGILKPDSVIIEPTSGNTGIGLCSVAAARGYKVIIVMPETMSAERRALMKAYGAELVLTEGAKGMAGAIAKADELARELPNAMVAGQFVNPANPHGHHRPRNLGGHRRRRGPVCGRGGHRRHHHRRGAVPEREKARGAHYCGGACRQRGALRRQGRPPRFAGHRRRVCA